MRKNPSLALSSPFLSLYWRSPWPSVLREAPISPMLSSAQQGPGCPVLPPSALLAFLCTNTPAHRNTWGQDRGPPQALAGWANSTAQTLIPLARVHKPEGEPNETWRRRLWPSNLTTRVCKEQDSHDRGLKTRYDLFALLSATHLSPCWRGVICVPRVEARESVQCQRHKPLAWRLPMPLQFLPSVPGDLEYDTELLSWKRH